MKNSHYFSHDFNARSDPKLINLVMRLGHGSGFLFWCIVEMLYEQGGYLPLTDIDRITYELQSDKKTIEKIINDFKLFEKDSEKFWSISVLNRIEKRNHLINIKRENCMKRWNKESEKEKSEKPIKLTIEERKHEFHLKVWSHENQIKFDVEMLNKFFDYWTEKNENGTKMRFEKQETFELAKRLATWKSNNFKPQKKEIENKFCKTSF